MCTDSSGQSSRTQPSHNPQSRAMQSHPIGAFGTTWNRRGTIRAANSGRHSGDQFCSTETRVIALFAMNRRAGYTTSLVVLVAVNILNFYARHVIGALPHP